MIINLVFIRNTRNSVRLKILFLIGNLGRGGKERQLVELIKNLPRKDYTTHILAKNGDIFLTTQIINRAASISFLGRKSFYLGDILRIRKEIQNLKPDIVYTWASIPSYFAYITKLITLHKFTLINGSIRDAPKKLNVLQTINKCLYKIFPFVVANSVAGLKSYGQFGKEGRFVLYNGFDFKRIPSVAKREARTILGFPQGMFVIPMIARLSYKDKDHECFIKSAAECIKVDKKIKFYIVGGGNEQRDLEKLRDSLKLNGSLVFLGKRNDVELILKASDLSVLCSNKNHGEGIPNAVLESQACGTPVIATNSGGTQEIIFNGKNGYLVESGDYLQFAERILELKNDRVKLLQFSNEGLITTRSKFAITSMINQFDNILMEVLRKQDRN